jgi:hypothetical protein
MSLLGYDYYSVLISLTLIYFKATFCFNHLTDFVKVEVWHKFYHV